MNFLFETYSGVAFWQIAGGWFFMVFFAAIAGMAIAKVFSLSRQLSRFKDRKRGKSGRFVKSEG